MRPDIVALYDVSTKREPWPPPHRDLADYVADPQARHCRRRPVQFWYEAKRTLHPIVGAA